MRKLEIPVGQVHTSMFNRAVETGTLLGFGDVTHHRRRLAKAGSWSRRSRTIAARRRCASSLRTAPPAGSNVVIVSHRPNILDAFGKDWFDIREGEASVFKPDGSGGYKLVARVQANEWAQAGGELEVS